MEYKYVIDEFYKKGTVRPLYSYICYIKVCDLVLSALPNIFHLSTLRFQKELFSCENTFRWVKSLLLDFVTVLMVEYVITVITYGQYGDSAHKKWIIGYLCDKKPRKTSQTYYRNTSN